MPFELASLFSPTYKVSNKCTETAQHFQVHTVDWRGEAKVKVNEPTAGRQFKVGFIQVVKAYDIRVTYANTFVDAKLPSLPMCDTDPATDAPWYEASAVPVGAGVSPELISPVNRVVIPRMYDRPSGAFDWDYSPGNPVSEFRRKQTFQTWLVVKETAPPAQPTYTTLYCFSFSIDQLVRFDLTKPVGQRCKVEIGASSQAGCPTTYNIAPFPKIPSQAFVAACPNTSQFFVDTVRV
jgi:hypothetical protein